MKTFFLIAAVLLLGLNASAQEKQGKLTTIVIQTSAECDDCKARIEEAFNYMKGVKFAELDIPSMKLTVKYNPEKVSADELKAKIASVGYDADEVKADPAAQNALPACCKPKGMKKQ